MLCPSLTTLTVAANPDQLAAIRLMRDHGWTPDRIAAALGLSPRTVYRRFEELDRLAGIHAVIRSAS